MKATNTSAIVLVALTLSTLFLAGCANRPDEAELTAAIQQAAAAREEVTLTPEQTTCISRWILASELSDTTVAGLAENFDNPEVLETEADKVEPFVAEAYAACRG